MPVVTRANGALQVDAPPTYRVSEPALTDTGQAQRGAGRQRPTGPISLPSTASAIEGDELIAALGQQELELVDHLVLEPAPEPRPSRAGREPRTRRTPSRQTVRLTLDVDAREDGVVLIEQDGVYTWNLPDQAAARELPAPAARRGARRAVTARRELTFTIDVSAAGAAPAARPGSRGLLGDVVFGVARAYVFKFAARIVVGKAMTFLERKVSRGLVVMDSTDPRAWRRIDDLAALRLPRDRPARILLFAHGTFSSTVGSFGSLGAYPWGRALLAGAGSRYDAVIGFDHPTLSVDPLENATDLLERLRRHAAPMPPTFDVVAYSRGGLIIRSLIEQLLPAAGWDATFDRIVFVAVTNRGTRLAEPDNWRALVDLYTNLVVAARRAIALVPGVEIQLLAEITSGVVQGIGAFVKYLVTHAISEKGVPGLAAMEPDGSFVTTLNATQPGQPAPAGAAWYAVLSDFEGQIRNGDHEPKELARRLVLALKDGLIDQLIGAANDLVVDTASITAVDPAVGGFIKDTLDFGVNPQVFHTNYFTRPETCTAIGRWLGLSAVDPEALPRKGRRRTLDVMPPGAVIGPMIPVAVDGDITVLTANELVGPAINGIAARSSNYVVVRRPEQSREDDVYAYRPGELISRLAGQHQSMRLGAALGLHESQASRRRSITDVQSRGWQESRGGAAALIGGWADAVEAELAEPTTTLPTGPAPDPSVRSVVFDGDRPVGVIAEPMPLPSAGDLATAATRVTVPVPGRVRRRDERRTTSARAAPPSPSPLPPPPPETPIEVAHFRAAMPAQTTTGAVVTVTVLVSPEILAAAGSGEVEARGQAPISPHRPVLIQVIPKAHVEVVGDDRAEVPVPLPAQGVELYFDIRPTHAGEGEVVVIARQGPAPLVTLRLKPMIAASDQLATAAPGRQTTAECAVDLAGAPDEPSSLHWLRIEETKQGDDTVYQYDFQAEDLKVLGTYRSQPLTGDHKAYVRQLYHEIERRWLSAAGDTEAFEAELRAFGGDLFDRLLPEELQRLLWKHRRRLKVMVLSSEPFIPWELVHLKPRSRGPLPRETVFLGQLGAVRWLHGTWPPDQLRIRSGRARFVIPRYPHPDWALPQAEAEQQFLKEHFGASAVTPDENTIRKLLARRGAFDLLHFAGHGFAESEDIANAQVMLTGRVENGNYIPAYLNATTVRQYGQLRGRTGNGPIIVFNACQTGRLGHQLTSLGGFAEAFLSVGAAAFISSLWSVGDVPARTFTEALYTALLDGESVSDATSAARVKAREAGDATWLAYVIYAHPRAQLTLEQQ